jgi:phenylpropionate dioxygenase-like ring-hydroxylating dioxygenase large terminal subunit
MTTTAENELMTRVEADAPLGRLMREHYWIPFALSSNLVAGDAPTPVRLFGDNYIAFRAENGQIGFFDELCPHRRASLALGRIEGNGVRCIYHGWKLDVSGCVVETPTQVLRAEQFAAGVRVVHCPVHEAGGIAWVWLGGADAPAFPDLPFTAEHGIHTCLTFSVLPCNWLQGLEGGLDSAHGTILHQSWIRLSIAKQKGRSINSEGAELAMASVPLYETQLTSYGMRAASLRQAGPGQTYVRVAHFFFPLVVVVPTGFPDMTQVFAFAPVDDTHHLLFFGHYGRSPQKSHKEMGVVRDDVEPDPHDFVAMRGDRSNRWGQNRELMNAGHFTGFDRDQITEDAVVEVSMGPIVDRSKENLSSSDIAVATARRLVLDALTSAQAGQLPPGTGLAREIVEIPNPFDAILDDGESWRDMEKAS